MLLQYFGPNPHICGIVDGIFGITSKVHTSVAHYLTWRYHERNGLNNIHYLTGVEAHRA